MWRIGLLLIIGLLMGPSLALADDGKCMNCHEGIEKISKVDGMKHLSCVDCHKGDAAADTVEAAHQGMYANPSDFRVIEETCGPCHPDEVENNMTSLHSTSAGKISGTRYDFGAQGRDAIYANYAVKDDNPSGKYALKELKEIPFYDPSKPEGPDNSPGDDY